MIGTALVVVVILLFLKSSYSHRVDATDQEFSAAEDNFSSIKNTTPPLTIDTERPNTKTVLSEELPTNLVDQTQPEETESHKSTSSNSSDLNKISSRDLSDASLNKWATASKSLEKIYSADDRSQVNISLQRDFSTSDFSELKRRSIDVSGPDKLSAKSLQGRFSGTLAPSQFNADPLIVDLDLQWTSGADNTATAVYEIILRSDAQGQLSRTAGSGAAQAVRSFDGNDSLILEISPTIYIHSFYLEKFDVFVGNFYSISDGKTRYQGPIELKRL
ncbi:MAG: hypothetical protein EOP07_15725 [Proteobacteria bacterium]|nr:MAG: hypothetical protein EOP07_15725 [Pseudomonadota bacterium]